MKAKRFLAFVAGAAMLFGAVGCTPDEDAEGGVDANITVSPNVITSTLADGATVTLSVTSNADWTVTCTEADVVLTPTSGAGNGSVTVSIPASTTENPIEARNFSINFKAVKQKVYEGYELPSSANATVSVYQNENGDESVATNVKAVRALLTAMSPTKDKADVTEEIASKVLSGVVVGAPSGGNMQDFTLAIQDNTTESGAGLVVTADASVIGTFKIGDIVQVSLEGAKVSLYNNLMQLAVSNSISKFASGVVVEPVVVTLDNAASYESQYVKFENVTPAESAVYKPWSTSTSGVNVTFKTSDNKNLTVRINPLASFKSEYVLPKGGDLCGVVGLYNSTVQLAPQTTADLQLTEDVEALQAKSVTIAEITEAGVYEVKDALVAGYTGNGPILTDASGAYINVYIYGSTHTTIGEKLTVAGAVNVRQGGFQFNSPYVTASGEVATVTYGEPKVYAGAELEALCEKYAVSNAAYLCEYVELKGAVVKSNEGHYGLVFPGVDAAKYECSLSKTPVATLNLDALIGQPVVLRGFVTDYNLPYLSVTATSVEEDSAAKYVVAENISGVPAAGAENLVANLSYVGVQGLVASCDKVVVTEASIDGNNITYTVSANEGAAREGWIKLSADGVDYATIVVSQEEYIDPSKVSSYSLTLDDIKAIEYSASWADWSLTAADGSTWSGFAYKNDDYYQFSYTSGNDATSNQGKSSLLSPVVPEGKKITKVTIYPDTASKTTNGRKFVVLPADFAYTKSLDSSGTEAVNAAYAVSSDTVKGQTDPYVIDLSSVDAAPRQVQIRAVKGAAYIIGVVVEFE